MIDLGFALGFDLGRGMKLSIGFGCGRGLGLAMKLSIGFGRGRRLGLAMKLSTGFGCGRCRGFSCGREMALASGRGCRRGPETTRGLRRGFVLTSVFGFSLGFCRGRVTTLAFGLSLGFCLGLRTGLGFGSTGTGAVGIVVAIAEQPHVSPKASSSCINEQNSPPNAPESAASSTSLHVALETPVMFRNSTLTTASGMVTFAEGLPQTKQTSGATVQPHASCMLSFELKAEHWSGGNKPWVPASKRSKQVAFETAPFKNVMSTTTPGFDMVAFGSPSQM
jgi:hypothetical protein